MTPADVSDLAMAPHLLEGAAGWALADANYGSAALAAALRDQGVCLLAPPRGRRRDQQRRLPGWVVGKRRRVETVIGQLVERYHLKRVWARDAWHLWSRSLRKLCSHTIAVWLCQQHGLPPLQFAHLVTT